MQQNKHKDSALSATLARTNKCDFEIASDFEQQAKQYHTRQEIENKTNPVMRHVRMNAVQRANERERAENETRRQSFADAERRWKELFE